MLVTNAKRPTNAPEMLGCQVPPFCLRVHGGPLDGQELRLTSAKVSVGGAAGCTLRLRSPGCLPLYAWVLRGPEGCVVRRFAPHVLLNGAAFDEAALFDGDRLRIGALELEVVSGAHTRYVDLEESEASVSDAEFEGSIRRTDADGPTDNGNSDPWLRPYKRAFASQATQTSQQRRALRQHHARRTRKLLETLRHQDQELEKLQRALQQKSADAARLNEAQQVAADHERIQLEEEARELAKLVEQMSGELRAASVQRARTAAELDEQSTLRTQIDQREIELRRAREEADEIRRSTAAQIEQLKHAFEAVRQERDELAERQEHLASGDRHAQLTIETLQAELSEALARRGALQARLEQVAEELAAARELHSTQQPQLEQQLKFLKVELERRDRELEEARSAASNQSQQLLATLDQLREELADLQTQRKREREQSLADAQELSDELTALKTQLAQRESELRTVRSNGDTEVASLRIELERAQAEAAHLRQQAARERSEATTLRGQVETELKSLAQQLERRSADLQAAQQSAGAEAAQFAKTIEQLRSELQSERTLRQQDAEARQADRRRSEAELTAAREQAQQQAEQIDQLQRQMAAEVSRLTLQCDQAQREASDSQTRLAEQQEQLSLEQAQWQEQQEELKQTISELTTARIAADQRELRTEDLRMQAADEVVRLTAELAQWKEQAEQLHSALETQQAQWSSEFESLQRQIEELTTSQDGSIGALQQSEELHQQAAAELERLGREAQQWREEADQLRSMLVADQEKWSQEQAKLREQIDQLITQQRDQADELACTMPSAAFDQDVSAERQQLFAEQQKLAAEREVWQQQRETWEASLREREEELAAQIAELERQVSEWHQRQSQERNLASADALPEAPFVPDAVYGSYNPPHNELPADVTMPLPIRPELDDFDRSYAPTNYGETAALPTRQDWSDPAETPDSQPYAESGAVESPASDDATGAAAEMPKDAPRDSDSVTAVLGRLMQAGLWNSEGGESAPLDQTLAQQSMAEVEEPRDISHESSAYSQPEYSHELPSELPSELPTPEAEEENFGCTMDMASVMSAREESPRSWRNELLGGDQPAVEENDPLAALRALRAEVTNEGDEPQQEVAEHDAAPAADFGASLPQQAKGHGSWRAQLLGESPEEEGDAHDNAMSTAGEAEPSCESDVEPAPLTFTPVTPPPAEPVSEEEDSIEAYMSKLLKRVRGDDAEANWRAPATPAPAAEAKKPEPKAAAPQTQLQPANPVDPGEFVPQRQAPEATMSLAAMRELANAASKVAIATHAKRSHTQRFAQRLAKAALALFTTIGFAVWGLYFHSGTGPWYGVAVGIFLMAYWIATSVWHIANALRLKPVAVIPSGLEETMDLPAPNAEAVQN